MGWADPHPWALRRQRRARRHVEAALVGVALACAFLAFKPADFEPVRFVAELAAGFATLAAESR